MKLRIILLAILTMTVFSCDDFVDINKNPNQTTSSTPELVLSAALNATANQLFFNQMGAFWAGQWCPSGDVSGFVQEKTYDFNNTYGTGIWTGVYDNLTDYKYVITESNLAGKKGTASIARIMNALLYHRLVDTYGNVPYKDAIQGTTIIRPTYDDAQSVYESIVEEIDAAVADLKAITDPGDNPKAADIIFGGDYTKWIQFGNTLKLRLLIRQSAMAGRSSYITTEIGQISGGYLTTDVNSNPGYLKTSGKQNPFWDNFYKSEVDAVRNNYNFYRSTQFLVANLPSSDLRRSYIVGPSGSSTQTTAAGARVGVPYGDETSAAYSNVTSGIGFGILKSYDMPMTLFTASESYFLQSEGVLRGYLAGDASTLYTEGVRASFRLLGLTNADADSHIATSPQAPYDGTVQRIITQKWVASVGYGGFEAWCDYRRTGFPIVPLSLRAIKPNIPVRLYYPNQEIQTNSANVAAQGAIDAITTKIFWDAN